MQAICGYFTKVLENGRVFKMQLYNNAN